MKMLPHDKDNKAMQQRESTLLVTSKPDSSLDSSLYQCYQEDQEHEKEQENLQDGSRRKRKWECESEAYRLEILETPRKPNVGCYCPPRPPRKPKAVPAMKGRAMWLKRSLVLLDVASEVESMFPPSVFQDFGKKIKKARS